jgi:hypothetical protein
MRAIASWRRLGSGILVSLLLVGCGGHTWQSYGGSSDSGAGGSTGLVSPGMSGKGGSSASSFGGAASLGGGSAQAGSPATERAGLPSSGCGKPLPPYQVTTIPGARVGYTEFHVLQTGATLDADNPNDAGDRQFFVRVPVDYDPTHPYRVVYVGQGCGEQRAGDRRTYELFNEPMGGYEEAVYVALSVPDNGANPGCYDNNSGAGSQEWEAFDLIHTVVESTYCVDNDRIYVAGYSTGGWLANMWGCYFAGTPSPPLDLPDVEAGRMQRKFAPRWAVRGHVAAHGQLPPDQPEPCNGPSAGLWLRTKLEAGAQLDSTGAAVNLALKTNGCTGDFSTGPKQAWPLADDIPGLGGGVCQQYTGCPPDVMERYPIVFCDTQGFEQTDMSRVVIPASTRFFEAVDPK